MYHRGGKQRAGHTTAASIAYKQCTRACTRRVVRGTKREGRRKEEAAGLETAVLGGHRWSSVVIGGHRWSSVVMGGHGWSWVVMGGFAHI